MILHRTNSTKYVTSNMCFYMIWFALGESLQVFDFKLIKNSPEKKLPQEMDTFLI